MKWNSIQVKAFVFPFLLLCITVGCNQSDKYDKMYKGVSPVELSISLLEVTGEPLVGTHKAVKKLVEYGADVNAVDFSAVGSSNTPLLMAAGALELDRSRYPSESFRDSCEIEAVKIVKYLVSKGADLYATDSSANRRNALHLAAIGGRPRMIHALVEMGMDINTRDRMNITPLIQAAGSGCIEAVKACVELGADINARMNGPRTALDAAYEFGTEEAYKWGKVICKDHQDIIAYLKKHGARRAAEFSE